jgi:uncharacterized protein
VSGDTSGPRTRKRLARCPICGGPRAQAYRPFCSARCRDIDLGRWFGEVYRVPAAEPGSDQDEGGEPVKP